MNSRTSLFNKSIIKSDFRRLWWVSALYTLAIFMTYTLNVLKSGFDNHSDLSAEFSYSVISRYANSMYIFAFIFPVITAALLFSYMQSGRASTFTHSIPVTRKILYFSHIFSGFILMILPALINSILLAVIKISPDFQNIYRLLHILYAAGITLLYSLVSFSIASFAAFVAGNTVAGLLFAYGFGALPAAIQVFIAYFSEMQLYGYVHDGNFGVMNFLYIGPYGFKDAKNIILYIAISVMFLILGYFIYKLRHIENHSEIVSFPKLKPLFVLFAGVCAGCVGYSYFNEVFEAKNILLFIPFGIIGIIIAQMIVKKSFKVPEAIKPIIIFTAFTICLHLVFAYDLTGYENKIPNADEIQSIEFARDSINMTYFDDQGEKVVYNNLFSPVVTEQKDFEKIISIHNELITNRYEGRQKPYLTKITYTLKNGKNLTRTYNIDPEKYFGLLGAVAEIDKIKQTYFPILRNDERLITQVEIHDERIPASIYKAYLENQSDIMNKLTDALKKDLKQAKGTEFIKRNNTLTFLNIKFKLPAVYEENGKNVPTQNLREQSETYYIRPSYKNTIKVLEELGLYEVIPNVSEFKMAGVEFYNYTYDSKSTKTVDVIDRSYTFHKTFEDKESIAKLYEYAVNNPSPLEPDGCIAFITDKHSFIVQFKTTDPNLPDIVKE